MNNEGKLCIYICSHFVHEIKLTALGLHSQIRICDIYNNNLNKRITFKSDKKNNNKDSKKGEVQVIFKI